MQVYFKGGNIEFCDKFHYHLKVDRGRGRFENIVYFCVTLV